MLANRSSANRRLVLAGAELHRYWTARAMGQPGHAAAAWSRFTREWTDQ
jgi:hypothetical protein